MTDLRIGYGYDVHRLVPGRALVLGGVTVPFEKGLLGHSDADVLTHAVMDALLGAAALAAGDSCELLAVHDGARPLILPEQVDDMVRLGQRTYAAAPALPVTDTVKVADMAGLVQSTPDRKTLYAVQTPQVFQANILKAALQSAIQAGADITDDCSAVERLGKEVWLAPGWRENIKITTREDLTMAEAFLRERENRA